MKNLLSANFARLKTSRLFWRLEGFMLAVGALIYLLAAVNTRNLGPGWIMDNARGYFFLPMVMFLPVTIAIFASFFIGEDYSGGVLRNKLIAGHQRWVLYGSFLVTVMAVSAAFLLAQVLAAALVGLPLMGPVVFTQAGLQPWRLGNILLTTWAYGALFTMTSMLDSQTARNLLKNLLLAAVVMLLGIRLYGWVSQPEFLRQAWIRADGSIRLEQGEPNPKYITGWLRTVLAWANACNPTGAAMISLDKYFGPDWRSPVCTLALSVMSTLLGMGLFRKKDIS